MYLIALPQELPKEEVKANISEAIKLYLEVLEEDGQTVPEKVSESEMVTI